METKKKYRKYRKMKLNMRQSTVVQLFFSQSSKTQFYLCGHQILGKINISFTGF